MKAKLLGLACAVGLCALGANGVSRPVIAQPLFLGDGSPDDAVTRGILAAQPTPRTIFAVRKRLETLGGTIRTHLVANGGHEHPRPRDGEVMFMAFETYEGPVPGGVVEEGELFFGFFLAPRDQALTVAGGFVELIAWDQRQHVYNFWELIGSDWFYRGNSLDILDNIASLGLGEPNARFTMTRSSPDGEPVLRCSGCHTLGAPIMKELAAPHNDWWREGQGLPLGNLLPDRDADAIVSRATDASNLARQVKRGIDRLVASPRGATSVRGRLRSLFSTMEMNLQSDTLPLQERVASRTAIEIPSAFFVDARLSGDSPGIPVDPSTYGRALSDTDSRFPPTAGTSARDTRHAFLVPTRSYIDNRTIDRLIAEELLDDELIADVLAVDMSRPVYSRARASLIRFVPETAGSADELRQRLLIALRQAPATDEAARDLLANLTDPARTAAAHRKAAAAYLEACRRSAGTSGAVTGWLHHADAQRRAIEESDTARHPRGLITEEGFRDIFPRLRAAAPPPVRLNPASCVAEPRQ